MNMLLSLALLMSSVANSPQITYVVSMPQPENHYFHIEITVKGLKGKEHDWFMPVWTPGSYLVREFPKNVTEVRAWDLDYVTIPVHKKDKNTWTIAHNKKDFVISYSVYAFEESVRTSFLDADRALFMPSSTCLYPTELDVPVTLKFIPPSVSSEFNLSQVAVHWKDISTPMEQGSDPWTRICHSRDELFDSPVEMGNHAVFPFKAGGNDNYLVMTGEGNYHADTLVDYLQKIIDEETAVFGSNPAQPYYFLVNNTQQRGGGLEHKFSSAIQFSRDGYGGDSYKSFLALMAHEYFHIWNVKRLRPEALGPFDYSQENYTTSLWIVEGFTSYYDDLILQRTGIYSKDEYLSIAGRNIHNVVNNTGDVYQSVADASFDAWIKAYRPNENSGNVEVSYYSKGGVLAMFLDMYIIGQSNGKYCLDDVMRAAYDRFYLQRDKGYTEAEFKAVLEEFAGSSLDNFYRDHVHGTLPLNVNSFVSNVGLEWIPGEADKTAWFGMRVTGNNTIYSVQPDGPAAMYGLNAEDIIVAVNNVALTEGFETIRQTLQPGEPVQITVVRRGLPKTFTVVPTINPRPRFTLQPVASPTEQQKMNFRKWMQEEH